MVWPCRAKRCFVMAGREKRKKRERQMDMAAHISPPFSLFLSTHRLFSLPLTTRRILVCPEYSPLSKSIFSICSQDFAIFLIITICNLDFLRLRRNEITKWKVKEEEVEVLATKWLRVLPLPPNDKIRNHLVANRIESWNL